MPFEQTHGAAEGGVMFAIVTGRRFGNVLLVYQQVNVVVHQNV